MDYSILSNLSIKQFQIFLTTAKYNNITKAAEELYLTQATVSRNIEALENITELKLFSRTNRGVQLTEAGKLLLTEWKWAIGLLDSSIKNAQLSQSSKFSTLTVGDFNSTDNEVYLLPIIRNFEKHDTSVSLQIEKAYPVEIVNGVIEGKYDAAFVSRPYLSLFEKLDFEVIDIMRMQPCLVLSSGNPLFKNKNIDPHEAATYPLIAMKQPFILRWSFVEKVFLECGFKQNEVRFVDNPHIMALELQRHPCVALMDRGYAPIGRYNLRYVDINESKTESGFVLVIRSVDRTSALNSLIKAAKDFADSQAKEKKLP